MSFDIDFELMKNILFGMTLICAKSMWLAEELDTLRDRIVLILLNRAYSIWNGLTQGIKTSTDCKK